MKYTIVTLIKGDAESYQQRLLYAIADRYDVHGAIQRKPPAHITLKYSFETDRIEHVESAIEEFCKTHQKSSYLLNGIGHFGNDVVFIDVIPSKEMSECYAEFISFLKRRTDISFSQYDGSTHFHSSVAHSDIEGIFDELWAHVSREMPYFECTFDNIAILALVDGVWQTRNMYGLLES